MDTVNDGDGDGDDDVKADDGVPDTIDCGLGQDRVDADPVDTVLSCELRTDLTIDTPISPTDVVLFGDVDGDGLDDLVTVSTAGVVMVRRSDGVDAFADPVTWLTWSGGATDMTLGDVDGDGDKDLIGRTGTSADIGVELSSGTAFGVPATWLTAAPAGTLRAADVDGSLTDDLVILQANGTVQEAYAEAGAFREIAVMVSLPAGSVPMFGDVDGDGLADLVLASAGRIQVRLSDAVVFGAASDWGAAPAGDLAVADADGDSVADLLARASHGTALYLASNGTAFGGAAAATTLPVAYAFATADVNGDGRADAVGRAGAAVAVRIGGAPVPQSDGDPWQPGPDSPEDPAGPAGLSSPQVVAGTPMALAWSDDDLTAVPLQAVPENDPDPAHRCANSQLAYDRMRQSGATYVRLVVFWSAYLDSPTKATYRQGLRNAVFCSQRAGLTPYMTITSADYDAPIRHDVNPTPAAFGALVSAVVGEFYPLGVHRFAMWNEPNAKRFLSVSCSSPAPVRTTALYRSLYSAGYTAARAASGNGAIVYLGELAEQGHTGKSSCGGARSTRKTLSTIGYLQEVAGTGDPVRAHGVAWHAYQHGAGPRTNAKGIGIYDVTRFQNVLVDLYHNGRLRTPTENKPGLYITEFGYLNVPFRAHNGLLSRNFWSEPARASFLPQALDRAARASVRMFLFWQLNEAYIDAPNVAADFGQVDGLQFDTGMLSNGALAPNQMRDYGKGPVTNYANPQARQAFCAVRAWAIGSGKSVLALASGC